jgi:hypothetical protein
MIKLLLTAAVGVCLFHSPTVYAGGVWSNQYCNLVTETTVIKDQNGRVVDSNTKEVMKCDDGAKDFLAYSGIAKDCGEFVYSMNLKGQPVQRKGYACQKFDGSWEVVRHPHTRN